MRAGIVCAAEILMRVREEKARVIKLSRMK